MPISLHTKFIAIRADDPGIQTHYPQQPQLRLRIFRRQYQLPKDDINPCFSKASLTRLTMIIVPEDLNSGSKKPGQESRALVQRADTVRFPLNLCFRSHLYILPKEFSDPPPSYSEGPDLPLASTSTSAQNPDPNINPSNFVYISNTNSKIQGKWVVDPALVIPRNFLPPLSSGETELTRKNLSLKSTNGLVHADVFVLPTSANAIVTRRLRERVLIHASSTNGRIQMNIVRNSINSRFTISYYFSARQRVSSSIGHLRRHNQWSY